MCVISSLFDFLAAIVIVTYGEVITVCVCVCVCVHVVGLVHMSGMDRY